MPKSGLELSSVQHITSPKLFASHTNHELCDGLTYLNGLGAGWDDAGLSGRVLSNAAAAMLTVLSSPLQVRSLTSARGKGASGVLHGATSSRGITESTRVQSPLNATIVTGNAAPNVVFKKPVDFRDWHGAASSQRQESWLPAERPLLSHCLDPWTMEGLSAWPLSSLPQWPGRLADGEFILSSLRCVHPTAQNKMWDQV